MPGEHAGIQRCDDQDWSIQRARIRLELESLVKQQFGAAIEQVVRETLAKLGVERALVSVDDKGALECILRARVQAAALRAAEQTEIQWSAL